MVDLLAVETAALEVQRAYVGAHERLGRQSEAAILGEVQALDADPRERVGRHVAQVVARESQLLQRLQALERERRDRAHAAAGQVERFDGRERGEVGGRETTVGERIALTELDRVEVAPCDAQFGDVARVTRRRLFVFVAAAHAVAVSHDVSRIGPPRRTSASCPSMLNLSSSAKPRAQRGLEYLVGGATGREAHDRRAEQQTVH